MKFKFRIKGHYSNNEAEYEALVEGLRSLLDLGVKEVKNKGRLRTSGEEIKERIQMYQG